MLMMMTTFSVSAGQKRVVEAGREAFENEQKEDPSDCLKICIKRLTGSGKMLLFVNIFRMYADMCLGRSMLMISINPNKYSTIC